MSVTFWADALVYATYVNNRLFHAGIQDVPYTGWTGRRANLQHLRAFGAHVSVRRSGPRPTPTLIIFIVVFYDLFHYGTPQSHRPAGAQSLIDKVLPNHVPPADKPSDTADSELPEYIDTSTTVPPLALDSVTDNTEHTVTANTAQLQVDSTPADPLDNPNTVPGPEEDNTDVPALIGRYSSPSPSMDSAHSNPNDGYTLQDHDETPATHTHANASLSDPPH